MRDRLDTIARLEEEIKKLLRVRRQPDELANGLRAFVHRAFHAGEDYNLRAVERWIGITQPPPAPAPLEPAPPPAPPAPGPLEPSPPPAFQVPNAPLERAG